MTQFAEDIKKFNNMYGLRVADVPSYHADPVDRLHSFKKILSEELDEIYPIIDKLQNGDTRLDVLTELADLLGDIQVYCASEMAKWGIPLNETLAVIMQSNFSKLGADGLPIVNELGKVQKGPGYWKPEPQLHEMLARMGI